LDFPFTFNGSATWNIANTFTSGSSTTVSTRTLTLTSGNVSFGSVQINCGLFSSTNTNSRNLDFGASGRILLLNSTTSTLWDSTIGTNFTWTGNFDVDCNLTGAITKTINFGTIAEPYAPNVKVATAGTGFGLNTTSATESVALSGNMGNLDLTSFVGTLTNVARNVYGNLIFPPTGGTFTAGATATTLAATSGTETITYNNRTIDFPLTINGTGGTFVANGNVLLGVTRTLTLTNGNFDANSANITASTITVLTGNAAVSNLSTTLTVTHTSGNLNLNSNTSTGDYTLTAGYLNLNNYLITTRTFSSSGSGVRGINFSDTGKIQLIANTAVTYWNTGTPTNFSYTGNSNIETASSGAVTKTINTGTMTESQALNWNLKDTAGTITLTSSNAVKNLSVNGTFTLSNIPITIYGNYTYTTATALTAGTNAWTFASTGTQTISSGGVTHDFPITFAGTGTATLQDNLTVGNTRTTTLTSGILNLNDNVLRTGLFSSTNSNARSLGFANTGKIQLSPTTTVTMWNSATPTNFSYTGNSNIETIGSGTTGTVTKTINTGTMTESQAMNWYLKDRSGIVSFTSNNGVKKLDLNGSFTLSNNPITIYDDYNYNGNYIDGYQSVYFDGTGDNLNVAANTALNLGTGDFTVECWVYYNDTSINKGFVSRYALSTGWTLRYDGGLNFTNGDTSLANYPMTPLGERWYHYAATRSGTTLRLFIDGVQVTSATNSTNLDTTAALTIGSLSNSLWFFNGYISNVRVLKGTALYTGNFTPSTTPLIAVANTVLLTCRSEQAIDISNNNFAITVNGNSTVNYFNPFDSANAAPILSAGTNTWTFAGTGTQNISTGGVTHDFPWTFNGVGGTSILQSNTTIGSTRTTTLTNGTFDLNGYNYTTGLFVTNQGTKTLQFDGGTLTISGSGATAFNNGNNTGFTVLAGSGLGSINLTSSSAKTFAGNNSNYSVANLNQGGTGTLTVTGNNSFNDISASITSTANATILLTANTTTTFNTFTLTSASGNTTNRPLLNSTVEYSRANVTIANVNANSIFTGANYIQCRNIAFLPYSVDGSDYLRWWLGDGSLSLNNNMGAVFQTYDANTSPKVYIVEANTSWTVPDDFNVSNNTIHMFGAGGGGGTGIFTGGDGFAGGGGGGGGYSKITNLYAMKNQKINLEIGIGGNSSLSANGGNTKLISWYGVYNAGGGTNARPGSGTAAGSQYLGGIGGSGLTFNGGNGGDGDTNDGGTYSWSGGGGGAGAGGPLGAGGSGGAGAGSETVLDDEPNAGGGGGGNGGGTNGTNGINNGNSNPATGGSGGNNAISFGRGVGSTGNPTTSFSGGGGAGSGSTTTTGSGAGSSGIDVLNSFGGGSGAGGGAKRMSSISDAVGIPGVYGGGGGGGGASRRNSGSAGAAGSSGSNGGIIIVYKPSKVPAANGSFLTLF
jgi:hypothetical protein